MRTLAYICSELNEHSYYYFEWASQNFKTLITYVYILMLVFTKVCSSTNPTKTTRCLLCFSSLKYRTGPFN